MKKIIGYFFSNILGSALLLIMGIVFLIQGFRFDMLIYTSIGICILIFREILNWILLVHKTNQENERR